ncbi:MAG TPA: hypothetical protein VL092_09895, partial [Chitinophagaceae bacterium]|nr:hypothetical protein [Chitinophagaceae bacterium]
MKLLISLLLLLHCAISVPAQTPVFDWAKSWKAASNALGILSMQVDDKGAAYFTGIFKGTRDFDPGPGVFKLTATPGTFLEDSFDVFIVKLDASGHFVWAKSLSGPYNDMAFSLALDRDRNVYTVGTFCATVDFDPGAGTFPLVAADTQSLYISKIDQDGNFVWAQTIGKRNLARLVNISKDSFLYVSGNAPDTTDIDPGPGVHMLNGAGPYVLKLDLDGHFIRAAKLGSGKNFLICATVDRTGNFYTGGRLSGSSDFDPDHGGYIVASNNAYLTKYDDTGKLLWIRELEGKTSLSGSWVTAVSSDSAQNLYASGSFFGTIDFDPG